MVSRKTKLRGNKIKAEVLVLTTSTDDKAVVKTFQYLYNRLFQKGYVFDPLKLFAQAGKSD